MGVIRIVREWLNSECRHCFLMLTPKLRNRGVSLCSAFLSDIFINTKIKSLTILISVKQIIRH